MIGIGLGVNLLNALPTPAVNYLPLVFTNLGASANPDINSQTDATSYANTSWTPPTTGMAFVFVQSSGTGGPHTPTVSGNNVTWTQIGTTFNAGSARGLSLFAADCTGSAAGITTVSFPASQFSCMAAFGHVENVDLSGGVAAAFVQQVQNGSTSNATAPTLTLSPPANPGTRPLAAFFHVVQETMNARANWTKGDELTGTANARALITQWREDTFEAITSATWATGSGWGGMAVEILAAIDTEEPTPDPLAITVSNDVASTSNLELTFTLPDNELNFDSAYRTTALASLDGAPARLTAFIGGFGEHDPLKDWNGTGSVPTIDNMFLDGIDRYAANAVTLGVPIDWIIWRLPWQFTENPGTGVNSVAADYYGSENRRLRADRVADYQTYIRTLGRYLMETHGARMFKVGSEMKGFQTDLTNGLAQTWDYGPYYEFYAATEAALTLAAGDATDVVRDDIKVIAPYPVVAHEGGVTANRVNFDTRATVTAPVETIRYKDDAAEPTWNMNNPGWGYPSKAPLQAIVEFFKLCAANGTRVDGYSVDFGMFNNDFIIYNGDDLYVAEQRTRDHLRWGKRLLTDIASGAYAALVDQIDIAEVYFKAQSTIAPGNHLRNSDGTMGAEVSGPFMDEAQRAPYMGAIKAIGLGVCTEEGVRSPSLWGVFGSGDGRTYPRLYEGSNNDEQRHYAAAIVRAGEVDEGTLTVVGQIYKWFTEHFSEGTPIHALTVSDPNKVYAIASDTMCMVVNKLGTAQTVEVNGAEVALEPYEVVVTAYTPEA